MELAMTMMSEMMGGSGASWAQEEIVVEGRDVDGLALRLQPGMKVSGRIVFDGAAPPAAAEVTRSRVMIANIPDRVGMADLANMMSALSLTSIKEDGTFEAGGLAPNPYRVQMMAPGLTIPGLVASASQGASPTAPPPAWTTKSVMLAGRDVADAAFDVRAGQDISGVVITMTDRISEIAGRVIDGAGRPSPGYPIVVFSTDRRYWTFGSRRIQQSRPASDGRYRISGLPAGEYYVCAATEFTALELYSPEFLEQLVAGSFRDHARRRREEDTGHEDRVRRVLEGTSGTQVPRVPGATGTEVRRGAKVRRVPRSDGWDGSHGWTPRSQVCAEERGPRTPDCPEDRGPRTQDCSDRGPRTQDPERGG